MLFLKEHRHIALHVACGDITDVQLDGNSLILNVFDGTLVQLLNDGKREIENALRWQGLEHKLVVNIKETRYSKTEEDISKLKSVFENIIIKEFKG
ncbi:MAG: hypothetical protein E7379_04530 [Clostridiales bacterium]|nr:hypothetical protein [Clostridiales bacterium]